LRHRIIRGETASAAALDGQRRPSKESEATPRRTESTNGEGGGDNASVRIALGKQTSAPQSVRDSVQVHFCCTAIRSRTMECTIDWLAASGMAFSAETGSGHLLTMDGAPDGGGRNLAPRPMETVLAGTGACAAYDVVLILKRGRHDVRNCRVQVKSERAAQDPKVFTAIHLHFVIGGDRLPPAAVERAIALSHDRYCSATAMLAKTATVTTSYELAANGADQM
jgi:putative redox protein